MKIVRQSDRGPAEQRMTVTGQVWFEPVLPVTDGTTIANVSFAPGARTFWHSHEGGQVLQIVSGRGLICPDGEQPSEIRAGDVVWIPAGERHWHGATANSPMTHLAISLGTTHWAEEVV